MSTCFFRYVYVHIVVCFEVYIPLNCCILLPQVVQFVRVATETGGPEARASIVDACDTILNLLIKVLPFFCIIFGTSSYITLHLISYIPVVYKIPHVSLGLKKQSPLMDDIIFLFHEKFKFLCMGWPAAEGWFRWCY